MHILMQLQLSNYDANGTFILEADSGHQMVMGRIREMLRLSPDTTFDVLGPMRSQLKTQPEDINSDLFSLGSVRWLSWPTESNALITRYDFQTKNITDGLDLKNSKRYDLVYINDPMLLRSFKALFHVYGKYNPKFVVHSHFVDNPENPKFPIEASLWLGQCEASIRADFNFWQCGSAMEQFLSSMAKQFLPGVIEEVRSKSAPYDDGYSIAEITSPVNHGNVRFDANWFRETKKAGKIIVFVPNRIGGKGRSSDYTNCGKFMFDILPDLKTLRDDYVVIAGNPSQKFSNAELTTLCGDNNYVSLVGDAFNRDEYKLVARHSDIVVGLYVADAYGSTASRECIELGCSPLWLDCNEYASLSREADWPILAKTDMSDLVEVCSKLIDRRKTNAFTRATDNDLENLRCLVRKRCSYEETTRSALKTLRTL